MIETLYWLRMGGLKSRRASSEAAGWITELESRDTGLWARVRWSDAGLAAVRGADE